eukprot:CAMPEP_0179375484 /NCGR_PEP_ID=MMETSP0797-20121207/87827_1 /TAXON_ID=47934 /ORGANISM="Dinophysis acuminata, Strain DAEP01" /LENGTH=362 /DNA_ID=CAMNT_0021091493 /DNA_START=57 /DNA_END=1143 /DNA_ORIENTATION=+
MSAASDMVMARRRRVGKAQRSLEELEQVAVQEGAARSQGPQGRSRSDAGPAEAHGGGAEVEHAARTPWYHCCLTCRDRLRMAPVVEGFIARRQAATMQRAVKRELRSIAAVSKGLPPEGKPRCYEFSSCCPRRPVEGLAADDELRFSPEQVLDAFRRTRLTPSPSLVAQALRGDRRWCCLPCCSVLCRLLLAVALALALHFGLALLVFGTAPGDLAVDGTSGALVDPASGGLAVGTAGAVALRPLWEYPAVPFDDLRRVEDVAFAHMQEAHVVRVAVVRTSSHRGGRAGDLRRGPDPGGRQVTAAHRPRRARLLEARRAPRGAPRRGGALAGGRGRLARRPGGPVADLRPALDPADARRMRG